MHVVLIEFRNSTPYPVQLANALGHLCQVTLLLPETASSFSDMVDRTRVNLELFHLPRYRQPARLAMMVRHLRRRLRALQPRLVHITAWHVWGTPGLGIFASWPLIATVHDISRHPGDSGLQGIPSALYPLQWRWADQVIVHATLARQQLLTRYGCQPERVHLIPIGAYDFYRTFARDIQPERPNTVLFFGRIWEYKGLQYLIEAAPLITKAIPDARIIIAGYGERFEKYQKAMLNPQHFEVHNYRIPDEQVAHFFQQASVVALPYIEASQSGVVSAAYAFGKPVVATRVGGLPEVVMEGQTGLLVPPADASSLANAIITLLRDAPLRHKMGQQARQFAETELSWQRIAHRTLEVYQKT
jgi:glycosyltransferase involved in cell wall biosynthesis